MIELGVERLVASDFEPIDGQRVGLITNQVSMVDGRHLIDWMAEAQNVDLARIFAAEHGVRGDLDAGAQIDDEIDSNTGIPVVSLYGSIRQPTVEMLADLDVVVFDLQDVGTRYYTYTATMGLAMQTAARAGVSFLVLDRPNPLGGDLIEGFSRTDDQVSFISLYPVPAVHGLTAGELAIMIRDEEWLEGVGQIDLDVIKLVDWNRDEDWPATGLTWIAPSPGLQTAASAATYPATVLFEATTLSHGAGTRWPFQSVASPWIDGDELALEMNSRNLPGVEFVAVSFTPQLISDVAFDPAWLDTRIHGVRLVVTDSRLFRPTAAGVHLLEAVVQMGSAQGEVVVDRPEVLDLLAGTEELRQALNEEIPASEIVTSWSSEVAEFAELSEPHRLYGQ